MVKPGQVSAQRHNCPARAKRRSALSDTLLAMSSGEFNVRQMTQIRQTSSQMGVGRIRIERMRRRNQLALCVMMMMMIIKCLVYDEDVCLG